MLGAVKGRWLREATQRELKRFIKQHNLMLVEWEAMNLTFFGHRPSLMIVRTNAMGADVRIVHGGWVYPNDIAYLLDWKDITYVGVEQMASRN
jgi:hypothetical protein